MNQVQILNVAIDNLSKQELLGQLKSGGMVVTPNVDHLIKLQKDPDFYEVYQNADYRICDSQIVKMMSGVLGTPIREKLSGSDLFPAFYNYYKDDEEVTIFLLGAAEGVAAKAQKRINEKVGREMVVGTYSPSYGFEKNPQECEKIIQIVNQSGATVLAVGLGAPKQEKWIHKYKNRMPHVNLFMAIGATIDFEAGNRPRSPEWISQMGLEWAHRLMSEPQRLWKRYLIDDLPFFWLILKQRLNLYGYQMPIGQLLQQAGLLSRDRVELILQEQAQESHLRFGDLVARRGWLERQTIDFFVEQFPKLPRAKQKEPLGQYLKQAALLDDIQIRNILNYQQQERGLRFGEIAVLKGWVQPETVEFFIKNLEAEQKARSQVSYRSRIPLAANY